MWQINGAMALWFGYWIFLAIVVWRYEKRNRELYVENLKLRKLLRKRGVSVGSLGDVLEGSGGSFDGGSKDGSRDGQSGAKKKKKLPEIRREHLEPYL